MLTSWMDDLPDLKKETYDLVAQVPEGRVTTYGEVAKALGDVVASRYVGLAMSQNDDIKRVPCRRVVQSDGFVGGYTPGGPSKKARLLRGEGIEVRNGHVVDLDRVLFSDFRSTYPLKKLRDIQQDLKKHLITRSYSRRISVVAGIDVAYDGEHGYAAMVSMNADTGEVVGSRVVEGEARFPYVPTYLSFREIPVIRPLLETIPEGTVVMYDGNGVLHPHGFGIASHLGVTFDVPTIGMAKKLLCGVVSGPTIRGARAIVYKGRVIGHALARTKDTKPVFVSVGHRVSRDQAVELSRRFLKYRIPEPARLAHITAEEARGGRSHK